MADFRSRQSSYLKHDLGHIADSISRLQITKVSNVCSARGGVSGIRPLAIYGMQIDRSPQLLLSPQSLKWLMQSS